MTTLTSVDTQLDTLFGLADTHAQQKAAGADRIAVLEARVKQLTRQYDAFREDHARIVAECMEERDARLKEQREYLERLEREVD